MEDEEELEALRLALVDECDDELDGAGAPMTNQTEVGN